MKSQRAFQGLVCLCVAVLAAFCAGCGMAPPARDPGAVTAQGLLGSPLLLANGQSTVYARIRIATVARPDERARGPVNVALAIDTSGSMEGAAIDEARKAALQMIDALKDGDRLAVIAYHSKTEVLLASSELDAEVRAEVKRSIDKIKADGTTDMAGGFRAALDEVRAHYQKDGINRVVLLGDGIPNNAAGIDGTAQSALENGIAVTTMGLGLDYDETLMGKIAQVSGGRFKYIASADKVAAFFHEELQRLDSVYARHATATLTAGPGVRIDAVVGSQDGVSGGAAFVNLGDIAGGDTRDIVVRMTVTPRKAGVPIELLDTQISFDDGLEQAGHLERHVYLGAHTVDEEAAVAKARNPEVELSAALAEASATTLQALALSKQGSYVRARELLHNGSQAALAQQARTPSVELKKHAEDMIAVAKDLPAADVPAAKPDGYEFRDDPLKAPAAAEMQVSPTPQAPPQPFSPSVVQKQKEVHQSAIDSFQ